MTEPQQQSPRDDAKATPSRRGPSRLGRWRLLLVLLLFAGLWALGRFTPLGAMMSLEGVQETMRGAGAVGFVFFVLIFALGELLHIPGLVFVVAAVLVYGRLVGGVAAYAGAVVSVGVSFVVVRAVGGNALAGIRRPFVQRMMERLDRRPILTVAVLRLVLWMAPPLNYALAMSSVRFRDYALGSALGLVLPIALASLFVDWFAARF